jgi:hypothetical protein
MNPWEEMEQAVMSEKTPPFIKIKTPDSDPPKEEDTMKIRFLQLEDGRLIPIETGGMVDIATQEFGAKIIQMDRIETDTDSNTA